MAAETKLIRVPAELAELIEATGDRMLEAWERGLITDLELWERGGNVKVAAHVVIARGVNELLDKWDRSNRASISHQIVSEATSSDTVNAPAVA